MTTALMLPGMRSATRASCDCSSEKRAVTIESRSTRPAATNAAAIGHCVGVPEHSGQHQFAILNDRDRQRYLVGTHSDQNDGPSGPNCVNPVDHRGRGTRGVDECVDGQRAYVAYTGINDGCCAEFQCHITPGRVDVRDDDFRRARMPLATCVVTIPTGPAPAINTREPAVIPAFWAEAIPTESGSNSAAAS